MRAVTNLMVPAVLAAGLAGLGVITATTAGATTAAGASTAPMNSVRPASWVDGGSYPLLTDCQASGQEAIGHGANQYRCSEVLYPDGQIDYWQLWLEY